MQAQNARNEVSLFHNPVLCNFKVRHLLKTKATMGRNSNFAFQAMVGKVDTSSKSLKFVKKLITVNFSNILFVRGCFDEDDYAKKIYDGVPCRILKEKSKDPMAKKVASWLKGAFDALEKKYLRKVKMVIYVDPEQPEQAHEVYSIKVSYPEGLPTLDVGQVEPSSVATELLKNVLGLTQGLEPPPKTAYVSFKLDYNEDTPEDYEPPGFEPHPRDLILPEGTRSLRAGSVLTKFHSLAVKVQTKPGSSQSPGNHYQELESSQGSEFHAV